MRIDPPRTVTIAPFTPAHIEGALRLSREVQWPHRAEDWALTLSISTGVVALQGDEVVGTALCTSFGEVAALNMIIVDRRMQGRGLGRKLMERVIDAAGPREMRLVATPEGRPLYEKLGFEAVGEIAQFQGVARPTMPSDTVHEGGTQDLDRLLHADLAASGMSRGALLNRIAEDATLLHCDGGFALLRAFGRGHVLGPVVARDAAQARALIVAAANRRQGQFLRIDMPVERAQAELVRSLGLDHVGGGIAMTCNARTRPAADFQTYALVSQALG